MYQNEQVRFTDLEVSETSGGQDQPERVFFFSFSTILLIDSVDVGLPTLDTPHFVVRPGPAAQLLLLAPLPAQLPVLGAWLVPPQVYVADKNANLVAGQAVEVAARACLASSDTGNGSSGALSCECADANTFVGVTAQTTSSGKTTFAALSIAASGLHRVTFTALGLASFRSVNLVEVVPGTAHRLALLTQPGDMIVRQPARVPPRVVVLDQGNNTVTSPSHVEVS